MWYGHHDLVPEVFVVFGQFEVYVCTWRMFHQHCQHSAHRQWSPWSWRGGRHFSFVLAEALLNGDSGGAGHTPCVKYSLIFLVCLPSANSKEICCCADQSLGVEYVRDWRLPAAMPRSSGAGLEGALGRKGPWRLQDLGAAQSLHGTAWHHCHCKSWKIARSCWIDRCGASGQEEHSEWLTGRCPTTGTHQNHGHAPCPRFVNFGIVPSSLWLAFFTASVV